MTIRKKSDRTLAQGLAGSVFSRKWDPSNFLYLEQKIIDLLAAVCARDAEKIKQLEDALRPFAEAYRAWPGGALRELHERVSCGAFLAASDALPAKRPAKGRSK